MLRSRPIEYFGCPEALVDPDTGKSLGTPDGKIGSIAVETVEEKVFGRVAWSMAIISNGTPLRFKGQPQKH